MTDKPRVPDLYPLPFPALVGRLDREIKAKGALYTLAERDWWTPEPGVDLSFQHMSGRAANALGPASGPHTQMAQNLVMAFIAGARFMELKTVQILDELEIPRPCIFAPNIGFNVEWSQELLVPQSAREYVAGWYLIHLLKSATGLGEAGGSPFAGPAGDVIFDMSLGYDLKGIQSEKVRGFIASMKDASSLIEQLRAEIRTSYPQWADVEMPTQLSRSTTLSTFHGCPADEIEGIAAHTLEEHGLHTVIKLNPTLLGHDTVRQMLDTMGYQHIELDPHAFDVDLKWAQLMDFLPRLEEKAKKLGLGLGVKFSNTLVCKSPGVPFGPAADGGEEMYLSGQPLHVLALTLADRFRRETGGRFPISFSAGVDQMNFHKLAAGGLGPITTCSDILKGIGYAKLPRYLKNLEKEIKQAGATDVAGFIASRGDAGANLEKLAEATRGDERYMHAKNARAPKKIGSHLALLDCITCDKCIKVCPNMANIIVEVEPGEHRPGRVQWKGDDVAALTRTEGEPLVVKEKHQIGNVVDLCNLCGQCDPWCPEDGGPYLEKAHLFITEEAWNDQPDTDGFRLDGGGIWWRTGGEVLKYTPSGDTAVLETPHGSLTLRGDDVVAASGEGDVDLRRAKIMQLYLAGFTAEDRELFVET